MNSSSESLYFGVPMIVIPVMGDQPIVAQRIEELEAGLQLNRKKLTPEILCNTAINLRNEAIRLLTVGTTGIAYPLEFDRTLYLGISHFKQSVRTLSGE